ncbi:hypothetical protein ACFQ34_06475 [Pseudonocardia benzenivorans]|uniref:SAM-dependent methyltransferase n=1 Tax=Pseudonocardia benzenivorans TaxID=228005 RepID=A0ABW3VDM5_9PSEU
MNPRPTSAPVRRGLRGRGLLVVWGAGDTTREATVDAGFNDWYTHEHLPERVATPGFRRARRWTTVDRRTPPVYLAAYETDDVDVLRSPAYLSALDDPTPGTAAHVPLMSGMSRTACRVVASSARGEGGDLAFVEFGPGPGDGADADPLRAFVVDDLVPELLGRPGTLAVHVAEVDLAVTTARDATPTYRDVPTGVGRRFLLVEGAWPDPATTPALLDDLADRLAGRGADVGAAVGMRLLARITHDQVVSRKDAS